MKNNFLKSSIGMLVIAMVLVSTGASSVFADFFRTVGQTFTAPSDSSEFKYGYGYGDTGWGYGYGYGYTVPATTTSSSGGGGYSSSSSNGTATALNFVNASNSSDSIVSISNKLVLKNAKYNKVTVVIEKMYDEIHLLGLVTGNKSLEVNFKKAYADLTNAIIAGDKVALKAAVKKFVVAYTDYKKALDVNVIKEYNVTKFGNNKLLFKTPIFKSEKMNKALAGFDKKAAKYVTKHISVYGDQEKAVEALNNVLLALRAYKEGDRVEAKKLLLMYIAEFKSYLN